MKLRFAVLFTVIVGCEPLVVSLPTAAPVRQTPSLGSQFDASQCGTLTGTVTWTGDVPEAKPFFRNVTNLDRHVMPNPHQFAVGLGKTLSGAVVFLRGIDPARSKAWDHAPVRVDLTDRGIEVCQGLRRDRIGFVKLGEVVTFQLADSKMQGVRVRGDAFFGQILTPQQPTVSRVLNTAGRVELSSASGLYWADADLFVMPHPYITVTDAVGHYNIDNVPAGDYELVVSHPNPAVTTTEIDPESSLIVRQTYAPPFMTTQPVTIRAKITSTSQSVLKN